MSRPSDPRTVLLWGDQWWLPATDEPVPFTDLSEAADALAAHWADAPKPVRLRLIYQPAGFASVGASCPQGDRRVLASALAGEFPALDSPDRAWSYEPVLPDANGGTTVLHFETVPALYALAQRLAHRGLAVESAWPLSTYLHALPFEWTDSGAVTVIAIRDGHALAYRHPHDAGRTVPSWSGTNTLAESAHWLGEILTANPEEPVLVVTAEDDTRAQLESWLGEDRPGLEWLRLTQALDRPATLPRYHPAQLLPRSPWVTAERLALAAGFALLLAAGWAGFDHGRDWLAVRAEQVAREARLATLQNEVAHLRANAAEIAVLRGLIEGGSAGPPLGKFLAQLSTTLPPDMVLGSVEVRDHRLVLSGWVAPAAATGTVENWVSHLAPNNAPWTLTAKMGADGTFAATGGFRR